MPYVIWKGKKTGIYEEWVEVAPLVLGFPGASYKYFDTLDEAKLQFKKEEVEYNHEIKAVYTDGGCIGASRSFEGGTWAFAAVGGNIETDDSLDSNATLIHSESGNIKGEITNNLMEFVAALKALEYLPDGWSGRLVSDSKITIGRLFYGWKTVGLDFNLVYKAKNELKRLGKVVPVLVDGHPTKKQLASGKGKRGNFVSKWNVLCDEMCNEEKVKV